MLGKFIGLEAYDVAESWRRLREGKDIKKHDLTLLWHEAYEYDLMKLEWNSGPHMDDFSSACDNTHHNKRNRLEAEAPHGDEHAGTRDAALRTRP